MSRLSAPRSSMKLASSVTLSGSTPRCSTTIFFTRSAVSLMLRLPPFSFCAALAVRFGVGKYPHLSLRAQRSNPVLLWIAASPSALRNDDENNPAPHPRRDRACTLDLRRRYRLCEGAAGQG